ncbi:MAG: hypothetical protein J6Y12_04670 [Lachnospiraceae bacterium]|nr:hypothetical protein [Lachnospiraceae bacterium]
MAAFDPIKSGIPEMDKALDNIRLGDNVVWRVSDLSQFRLFMEPYLEQAIEDIVHVYNVSGRKCEVYNDAPNEHLLITC